MQYHMGLSMFKDYGEKGSTLGQMISEVKNTTKLTNTTYPMVYALLGDPAIRIRFPQNRISVTEASESMQAGKTYKISGVVNNADGTLNTDFNGPIVVSLYDVVRKFATIAHHSYPCEFGHDSSYSLDTNYPRELLTKAEGTVANGKWTVDLAVPMQIATPNTENLAAQLRLWAADTKENYAVNGRYNDAITLVPVDNTQDLPNDTEGPALDTLYLNDEEAYGLSNQVAPNSVLYAQFTDESGINALGDVVGAQPKVVVDGTVYTDVKGYTNLTNEGKTAIIAYPLHALKNGHHTASVSICDIYGNRSSEATTTFIVSGELQNITVSSSADASGVVKDNITINVKHEIAGYDHTFTLKVFDTNGNLVYTADTAGESFEWNLIDADGNRLKPAVYRYYVAAKTAGKTGGSDIKTFTVF